MILDSTPCTLGAEDDFLTYSRKRGEPKEGRVSAKPFFIISDALGAFQV